MFHHSEHCEASSHRKRAWPTSSDGRVVGVGQRGRSRVCVGSWSDGGRKGSQLESGPARSEARKALKGSQYARHDWKNGGSCT